MVGSIKKFDSKEDEEDWICELMGLAFGKLCMPLRVRMTLFFFFFSFFKNLLFCSSIVLDESPRRYDHRKAVLFHIKLRICSSSIL